MSSVIGTVAGSPYTVADELNTLSRQFPPGIKYQVAFETTSVISQSIHEVLTTLGVAIVLVIVVMAVVIETRRE